MVTFYTPPKKTQAAKTLSVTVNTLDAFGQGVVTDHGKTIFIKQALPTEKVDIRITEDKRHYAKATVVRFHSTSDARVKPKCRHYGVCGGCDMQHITPSMQQTTKFDALIKLLQRETKTDLSSFSPSIIAADDYHYRRRARLSIHLDKQQRLQIGFRQSSSNTIVNIQMCPVLVNELETLIIPMQACLQQIHRKKALGHLEMMSVTSGLIVVLRITNSLTESDIQLLKDFAQQYHLSFYLLADELVSIAGDTAHYYEVEGLKLTFSPLDFIQVNERVNEKMIAQALDWLALTDTDHALDLFCGMGNFSLPMAKYAKSVIGVEGVDTLVEKAKINTINNKGNISGSAQFFVTNLDDDKHDAWRSRFFSKVLLDPARAGALNMMAQIVKMNPQRVVYISCNPATLARDSKILIDAGYCIVNASILDMFPQTKHIESMLLFMKSGTT